MKQLTTKPDNRLRAVRGGSWSYVDASDLRPGARFNYGAPAMRIDDVGFRTALAWRLPR